MKGSIRWHTVVRLLSAGLQAAALMLALLAALLREPVCAGLLLDVVPKL